jgi:hypothetical protein
MWMMVLKRVAKLHVAKGDDTQSAQDTQGQVTLWVAHLRIALMT